MSNTKSFVNYVEYLTGDVTEKIQLDNIRITLVKSGNRETTFVFETMDVDQARLFSTLCLGDAMGANL